MNKEKIQKSFAPKILAVRNYTSDDGDYGVAELTDPELLWDIIAELDTGESDITPAGKVFLRDYYGYDFIAQKIYDEDWEIASTDATLSREQQVAEYVQWLETMQPMELSSFIAEAQGTKLDKMSLRDKLLPPAGYQT